MVSTDTKIIPRKLKYDKDGFPIAIADFYRAFCFFQKKRINKDWSSSLNDILRDYGFNHYNDCNHKQYKEIFIILKRNYHLNKILE